MARECARWGLRGPVGVDLEALGAMMEIYGIPLDEPRDRLLEEPRHYPGELKRVARAAGDGGDSLSVVMS